MFMWILQGIAAPLAPTYDADDAWCALLSREEEERAERNRVELLDRMSKNRSCGGKSDKMLWLAKTHSERARWLHCRSGVLAARPHWEKSELLLKNILRNYPRFYRYRAVAFQRAQSLIRLDPQKAIDELTALLEDHPDDSRATAARLLVPEAHTRIGNHAIAAAHYAAIDLSPDHPDYAHKNYQHGWALYRAGHMNDAILRLKACVESTDDPQLHDAALTDVGRLLVASGRYSEIDGYNASVNASRDLDDAASK